MTNRMSDEGIVRKDREDLRESEGIVLKGL